MSLLTLTPGITHTVELMVSEDLTVPHVSPQLAAFADMPGVFATAYMVAFAEAACIECIEQNRVGDEHTVGIHIDVSHIAATPPGMTVTAEVRLTGVDGKFLTFDVDLRDAQGPIGKGEHRRAIIFQDRFNRSLETKRAALSDPHVDA